MQGAGGGRGISRGRGSSRGRGQWIQKQERETKSTHSITRPYKRSSSGGRDSINVGKRTKVGETSERNKVSASKQVLARATAIRESASQFARDGASEDSSDDEEDEAEGREVVKKMLKIYYQDLGSDGAFVTYIRDNIHVFYIYIRGIRRSHYSHALARELARLRFLCRWREEGGR